MMRSSAVATTHAPAESIDAARLRLAVEASGEIIFMTDVSGTFTYVNPAFVRVYGYEAHEVVGRATPRILKSGRTPDTDYAAFWRQLVHRQVVRREFLNRTKDGRLLDIDSCANPVVDAAGNVVGFLAVQRDVTEWKTLEQQLVQSQKMEAIGRLAGGIAHDFNNLLTAILGYGQLVHEGVRAAPEILADVEEIMKAGERASRLTRQLLAFSRKQPMTRQAIDLNALVADVDKMLRRVLGEDIDLQVHAASDIGSIVADPGQVEQVVLNLVVNSRDAMPKGGRLAIRTANRTLDEAFARRYPDTTPGEYVALAVEDTGTGMTKEVLAHVFEPFFSTKPAGQGTGLGLATVYGIIKQNGGCVMIESEPGAGTTVTTFWPKKAARPKTTTDLQAPPRVLTGAETILLVEDEPGVRALMKKTLEPYGYRVLEAGGATDALALAATHPGQVDLLLSDVILPGLNGPDLAQRFVAMRPTIRVLYVSGFTNSLIPDDNSTRQRVWFLPKPFTPLQLATRVRDCLDA